MLTSSLSTTALLSLALAIAGVEAGSRAWESSVKYARTAEMEAIHARDLAFQAHGNGTTLSGRGISRATTRDAPPSSQHDKRWIGIKPDGATLRLWPQGNIKVCFEQQTWPSGSTTEDILRPSLASARGLWRDRNLDDRDGWFQFEFVADAAWCNDRANRPDYLLVMYAGPNVQNMATTPGMGPKLDTANTRPIEDLGPKMMLSDVLTMGHKNVVANFAHEMGVSRDSGLCMRAGMSLTDLACYSTPGVCITSTRTRSGGTRRTVESRAPSTSSGRRASSASACQTIKTPSHASMQRHNCPTMRRQAGSRSCARTVRWLATTTSLVASTGSLCCRVRNGIPPKLSQTTNHS